MSNYSFSSVFASEMEQYLNDKVESGYQDRSYYYKLREFDAFCVQENITEPVLTKELADKWVLPRVHEATTTHYARINKIKNFLIYLAQKGYSIYITRDIRSQPTNFQPHIYTDQEIKSYFNVVDHYESRVRRNSVQLPVIFRTLYCCGLRLNESLGIRKKDVDLKNGIIKLTETKNNTERYIVLSSELLDLYRRYADKTYYMISEDDYIFSNAAGGRIRSDTFYKIHRSILQKAGIPFVGNGEGPRIHDFRHTFAVRSFKQLVDKGYDMYVALPILSTYLGHKTIYATEGYVRLTCSMYPYIGEKFSSQLDKIYTDGGLYENH